jgi:aldose 1-epimerase
MTNPLFGKTKGGQPVHRIRLQAGQLTVHVLTWGAVLHDVRLSGHDRSLVLNAPEFAAYEAGMKFHGSVIGPVVNRIRNARAPVLGQMHQFEANQDARHLLHSGTAGTQVKNWQVLRQDAQSLALRVALPAGEGGFPGDRIITALYRIDAPAQLTLSLTATTSEPTLMNLAGHSYWNLGPADDLAGHRLQVYADRMLPTDMQGIPTGEIRDVTGTPYDFRQPRKVIAGQPPLDHNFCLSDRRGPLQDAARLTGPGGLTLRMQTTEPGLQVYDARHPASPKFSPYGGMALEAQGWPDAPNQPGFPNILLHPHQTYEQVTRMSFRHGSCPDP